MCEMAEEAGGSHTPYGLFEQEDVEEAYQEVLSVKVGERGRSGGVTFNKKVGEGRISYKAVSTEHLCHAMVANKTWFSPVEPGGASAEGDYMRQSARITKKMDAVFPHEQYSLMQELLRRVPQHAPSGTDARVIGRYKQGQRGPAHRGRFPSAGQLMLSVLVLIRCG